MTLTWTTPATGPAPNAPTSYIVEAGSAPGLSNLATAPLPNQTAASFSGVPPGTYFVRVRARNGIGTGPVSNEVRIVVP